MTITTTQANIIMDTIAQYLSMSIGRFAPTEEWIDEHIEDIRDEVEQNTRDCFITMCNKLEIEEVEEDA